VTFMLRGLTSVAVAVRCWAALAAVQTTLTAARQRGRHCLPVLHTLGCTLDVRRAVLRGVLGYGELGAAVEVSGV
jgi:hypothetical protein